MTVSDWFSKRLGIDAMDYEVIANVQFGAATYAADFEALNAKCPLLAPSIQKLLCLSTVTPEDLVKSQPAPTTLLEAVTRYEAHRTPARTKPSPQTKSGWAMSHKTFV
jgi:hypothetical protein